ncbi:MAG: SLBB domain-containing protein [Ignavibacterium sp.]|nr:SLBB domain-containing protein [Ignavibacterium sp.]
MKNSVLILILLLTLCESAVSQTTTGQTSLTDAMSFAAISVTIGGQFPINGTFPALITERADQFISRMYAQAVDRISRNTNDPLLLDQIKKELESYSLRGIILKRNNGEELSLDLLRFRITGDFSFNPYLKNDDILIFPAIDLQRNFFSVSGAVNQPGKIFFVEGDNLQDALLFARGINPAYEGEIEAEINRPKYDGSGIEIIKTNINSSVSLQRGDQIIIQADETHRKEFNVLVIGEVNSPGYVPITRNNTRLGEIIDKAGGFTSDASILRSRLFRGNSINLLLERQYGVTIREGISMVDTSLLVKMIDYEEMLMLRMSNLVDEDIPYFQIENQIRVMNEGSVSDFSSLNDPDSEIHNLIVRHGDVIIVPQKKRNVYVFGQVQNPGFITYSPNKDYKYYLNLAGGVGKYSEDEIKVIKGESRYWVIAEEEPIINEGDFIFVPKQQLRSFRSYVQEYASYLSIIGSVATLALLIVQLGK